MSTDHRLTHVGLCVTDIARSAEFYCTALGFTNIGAMHVDDAASARLLDIDNLVLDLVYLQRDGFRLELLAYPASGATSDGSPRRMNVLGFTHLSFRVDDADALTEAVIEHGGQLLADRTVVFAGGNRGLMLTDPDGNLLEIIERVPNH